MMKEEQKKTFYLKIGFNNKIKKYSFNSTAQINFQQIKKSFGLNQFWKETLYCFQIVSQLTNNQEPTNLFYNEQQLIKYINSKIVQMLPKQTLKILILQRAILSEQQKRRKQSFQSFEIPQTVNKKRSKSEQLDIFDLGCKTQIFDISSLTSNEKVKEMRHTLQYQIQQSFQKNNVFMTKKQNGTYQCLHNSLILNKRQKNQLQKIQEQINRMILKHNQQKRNVKVKDLLNFLQQ